MDGRKKAGERKRNERILRPGRRNGGSIGSLETWGGVMVILTGFITLYVNLMVTITWENEHDWLQVQPPEISVDTGMDRDSSFQTIHQPTESLQQNILHHKVKKNISPLLNILQHANMTMPTTESLEDPLYAELNERLPDWQNVQDWFGKEPKIIGLDRCEAFNAKTPVKLRAMGPAGPFNSGTNYLYNVLTANCKLPFPPERSKRDPLTGLVWQVPWGKHQSPRFRQSHRHHSLQKVTRTLDMEVNEYTLPIVMVRDPFSWFQSMCKVRYAAHWYHIVPHHCPNFIPNHVERDWYYKTKAQLRRYYNGDPWKIDNVHDKANFTLDNSNNPMKDPIPVWVRYKSETRNHASLAHMWHEWYEEYYYADWPRLMVRLEDLVFYPQQTIRQICECFEGATYFGDDQLSLTLDSVKFGSDHIHGKADDRPGLIDAMINHVLQNRTKGMTEQDYAFVTSYLEHSKIRQEFGYRIPEK